MYFALKLTQVGKSLVTNDKGRHVRCWKERTNGEMAPIIKLHSYGQHPGQRNLVCLVLLPFCTVLPLIPSL